MFNNEGLRLTMVTLKRAYVNSNCCSLQLGAYLVQIGPIINNVKSNKGLCNVNSKEAYTLQRGPSYFKEGLSISKIAYVLDTLKRAYVQH